MNTHAKPVRSISPVHMGGPAVRWDLCLMGLLVTLGLLPGRPN